MLAHEKTYRLVRPAPRFSERAFPDPDRGRANVSVKRGGLTFLSSPFALVARLAQLARRLVLRGAAGSARAERHSGPDGREELDELTGKSRKS